VNSWEITMPKKTNVPVFVDYGKVFFNHSLNSPTCQATTPSESFIGLGAMPALTIRRQVLLDTGTMRGLCASSLPRELLAVPRISFSRIRAESGKFSKNDRSGCSIVIPHGAC
jgi:hypothetical protein